jgi:hypothetical protein
MSENWAEEAGERARLRAAAEQEVSKKASARVAAIASRSQETWAELVRIGHTAIRSFNSKLQDYPDEQLKFEVEEEQRVVRASSGTGIERVTISLQPSGIGVLYQSAGYEEREENWDFEPIPSEPVMKVVRRQGGGLVAISDAVKIILLPIFEPQ